MISKYKLVFHPSWDIPKVLEPSTPIEFVVNQLGDGESEEEITIQYVSFEVMKVHYGEQNVS